MAATTVVKKEFDFKLATAKDIPPSWYELVLRPSLFQQHVNDLHSLSYVEPSAVTLIAVFLEKAVCIPEQAPLSEGVTPPIGDRKARLIDCALFLATFLRWNIKIMEQKLPSAVLHALFSNLADKFPLNYSITSIDGVPMDTLCAHTLYNLWVVHCLSVTDPPPLFKGYQWDGTCAPLDSIKSMIRPKLDGAIKFLDKVLKFQDNMRFPVTSIELPLEMGLSGSCKTFTVNLPYTDHLFPYKEAHALIHYNLGKVYFEDDLYSQSLEHFQSCTSIIGEMKPHPLINRERLTGYVTACKLITKTQSESSENLLTSIESHRHGNVKGAVQNLPSPSLLLPATYRAGLEKELFDWSEMVSIENSRNKRRKLSDGTIGRGLTLSMQLGIWDIIQGVLEGRGINPTSLNLLNENSDNEEFIDVLLTSVEKVLSKPKLGSVISNQLGLFLSTLSSNDTVIRICTLVGDHPLICSMMGISKVESILSKHDQLPLQHCSLFRDQCSRYIPILVSPDPSSLKKTVSDLLGKIPKSEHISTANTLQGDSRQYANVGQMNTPLLCAQYNGLVRKGLILRDRKDYKLAAKFCTVALEIANTSSSPNSLRLVPILKEQNLRMKILATSSERKTLLFPSLLEDIKSMYINNTKNSSVDPFLLTLGGVYLMNINEYSFLSRHDGSSTHERICPRLAGAVLCAKGAGQDTRRSIRELFDTISGVFSGNTRGGGGDSGSDTLQRKCLELVAVHLKDTVCLSYFISALVRLWNIVKKPENELSCEYTTNWPTTVGNINFIKARHVMRVLEVALSNAMRDSPSHYHWFITRADISFFHKRFGTALLYYLEAGAMESSYFERPVSDGVWSKQIIHRMITCCCSLELYTQAVVLCQFAEPINYNAMFLMLKEHSSKVLESVFDFLWDMTIIEYLIYILAKQGDTVKQFTAIQAAGRPELNTSNSLDILKQVASVRKRLFLRNFYRTISSSPTNSSVYSS